MDPVTATSSATVANGVAKAANTAQAEKTNSDFNDFLKLLTTQLRNQDPLKPTDSTQFVEQLATFSAVEQQVNTNSKLDQLISQGAGASLTELAGWIGREVRASGVGVPFEGEPLTIKVPADAEAERASVAILDAQGREIATLPADPSGGNVTWNGKDTAGADAPIGVYSMEFVYGSGEGADAKTWRARSEGYAAVREARIESGAIQLVLADGTVVSPDAVTGVRDGSYKSAAANAAATAAGSVAEQAADAAASAVETVTGAAGELLDEVI